MPEREQLAIELDRNRVVLTLTLATHYAAIETYEKLLAQAREGFVLLDLETAPAEDRGLRPFVPDVE